MSARSAKTEKSTSEEYSKLSNPGARPFLSIKLLLVSYTTMVFQFITGVSGTSFFGISTIAYNNESIFGCLIC